MTLDGGLPLSPRILTTLVIDGKHFVLTLFRFQSGLCSASVECATHVTGAERLRAAYCCQREEEIVPKQMRRARNSGHSFFF